MIAKNTNRNNNFPIVDTRVGGLYRRIRYELRSCISVYPTLYLPLVRLRHWWGQPTKIITKNSDIVIEGFPRSGNTFCYYGFLFAQKRSIRVAHHLHAPAQVIEAVRNNVPVLVLIRDPGEAVASLRHMFPDCSAGQLLRDYARFYGTLLPYAEQIVTASFEQITSDLGGVIKRINEKYSTSFVEFEHNDENVRAVFSVMEKEMKERRGSVIESSVARPSPYRAKMKDLFVKEIESPKLGAIRAKAFELYRVFLSYADSHPKRGQT